MPSTRPADLRDLAELGRIRQAAIEATDSAATEHPPQSRIRHPRRTDTPTTCDLAGDDRQVIVAEDDAGPCGWAILYFDHPPMAVGFVAPWTHRQPIQSALVDAIEARGDQTEIDSIPFVLW